MDQIFNTSTRNILIKDISNIIDFELLSTEFEKLTLMPNVKNHISESLNFLDSRNLAVIKRNLEKECEEYMRNVQSITDFDNIKITNSWGNVTRLGEEHHDHQHPFSVVSGVIYLDDNPDNLNLTIETHTPMIPYHFFKRHSATSLKELTNNSTNLKNHLVLFLSDTMHLVSPSTTDMPRRSISFNTFWSGVVGFGSGKNLSSIKF